MNTTFKLTEIINGSLAEDIENIVKKERFEKLKTTETPIKIDKN